MARNLIKNSNGNSEDEKNVSERRKLTLQHLSIEKETVISIEDDSSSSNVSPIGEVVGGFPDALFRRDSLLDICIFLPDRRGIQFTVVGGRVATTKQLCELAWKNMDVPGEVGDEYLSLWMCSPLLEVQLKSHHVPFKIRKHWISLLRRFSCASEEEMNNDEPILMIKRNVFLPAWCPLQKEYSMVSEILYLDAKECVLTGRYLCKLREALQLAAWQMAIEWGAYDSEQHTVEHVRNALPDFLPDYHLEAVKARSLLRWVVPGFKGLKKELIDLYERASELEPPELQYKYITLCANFPSYGAAFFHGRYIKSSRFRGRPMDVLIGISQREICLIDDIKGCNVTAPIPLASCEWWYQKRTESEPLDCLMLDNGHDDYEFSVPTGSGCQVQLFSNETPMMVALLQSFRQIAVPLQVLISAKESLSVIKAKRFSFPVVGYANMWIFGYGSLLWYTNFPYIQSVPGFVRGYVRRFWQASPDHRGTPEKPGRTVTLVPQETGEVWGIAYRIADEIVDDVLKYLYWREKAGYECKTVQFYPRSDVKMDPFPLQLFMSRGEGTEYFVTGESEDEIARRIVSSSGPSGTNIEYVLRLAKRLHEIGPESNDEHVERIAKLVLSLCQELKIKDPDLTDYIKDALTKG